MPRARGFPGSVSAVLIRTLDAVYGRSGTRGLQVFLQCRFIVAQRGSGAQLLGQLLGGFAHHPTADKSSDRLHPSVQKERAQHGLHGIGEHGTLASEATLVLTAAEAQMTTQADSRGDLRQMLPAH
jgi:hypothetical protein